MSTPAVFTQIENENFEALVSKGIHAMLFALKCRKNCPCRPQPLSWQSMDGKLTAILKHDKHLFIPMQFPKKMPNRIELFDRLTFMKETGVRRQESE